MREDPRFPNLCIVDHPLIQDKLTAMRDKDSGIEVFRRSLREIAMLMGYEITRDLPLGTRRIETPMTEMDAPTLDGVNIAVVPILRAGLGMAQGLLDLMPSAMMGHVGLYRDEETHEPVEYLVKLPPADDTVFIVVDPMLATGGSASHAIDVLLRRGIKPQAIRFMALVGAPEGAETFHKNHPDIRVYIAALDDRLNENAYIIPGLGDAGDRMFGT